jgi:CRISPR-associated protein Csm2
MEYDFDKIKNWISTKLDKDSIDFAEEFGKYLCDLRPDRKDPNRFVPDRNALTTSQIRNFFGEIKRIQAKGIEKESAKAAFLLIRPKLAYAEARVLSKEKMSRISDFRKVMESAYNGVNTSNSVTFQNFVDFFEAILAYHKSAGGN